MGFSLQGAFIGANACVRLRIREIDDMTRARRPMTPVYRTDANGAWMKEREKEKGEEQARTDLF